MIGRHLPGSGDEGKLIVRHGCVSLVKYPAQLSGLGEAQADVRDGESERLCGAVHANAVLRLEGGRHHLGTASWSGAESELLVFAWHVNKENVRKFSHSVSSTILVRTAPAHDMLRQV